MMVPQLAHAIALAKRGVDAMNEGSQGLAKKMRVGTTGSAAEANNNANGETKTDDHDKAKDDNKANDHEMDGL